MWGSLLRNQGLNLCPCSGSRVLTTGMPGKSLGLAVVNSFLQVLGFAAFKTSRFSAYVRSLEWRQIFPAWFLTIYVFKSSFHLSLTCWFFCEKGKADFSSEIAWSLTSWLPGSHLIVHRHTLPGSAGLIISLILRVELGSLDTSPWHLRGLCVWTAWVFDCLDLPLMGAPAMMFCFFPLVGDSNRRSWVLPHPCKRTL